MKNYNLVYYCNGNKEIGSRLYERDEAFNAIYDIVREKIKQLKPGETITIQKGYEHIFTKQDFNNGTTEREEFDIHYAE